MPSLLPTHFSCFVDIERRAEGALQRAQNTLIDAGFSFQLQPNVHMKCIHLQTMHETLGCWGSNNQVRGENVTYTFDSKFEASLMFVVCGQVVDQKNWLRVE